MKSVLDCLQRFVNESSFASSFPRGKSADKALDARDVPAFEKRWIAADDRVSTTRQRKRAPKGLEAKMDEISEAAYLKVLKQTGHDELAGQVSDDFLLIAGALLAGCEDEWINGLWLAYSAGSFPYERISPVPGKLVDVITASCRGGPVSDRSPKGSQHASRRRTVRRPRK